MSRSATPSSRPLAGLRSGRPDRDRATRILTATDVRALLSPADCIDAVERVLLAHASPQAAGEAPPAGVLSVHTPGGGFHIKAAAARLDRFYFASKTNGNFPGNPDRLGLPTIQGVIVLGDARDGRPLAVLDSIEVTSLRTAAATALAARHLSRPDSSVATIVGCGTQAPAQLRALATVRAIERVFCADRVAERARRLATELGSSWGVAATAADDLHGAMRQSDIIVTCTSARQAIVDPRDVPTGAFLAAVGADHPEKQEIDPRLFASATVVVDSLEQCAAFGDLHHAIAEGVMTAEDVHGELWEIVAGRKPGRSSVEEIILFDSTGTALQDVAAAAVVYEQAVRLGRGQTIRLAD